MILFYMKIVLKSDATFGRGDGVTGLVDTEVMYDELGLPYLGGRAIKGILVNECADILAAIPNDERKAKWVQAAARLFGCPGSTSNEQSILSISNATLPEDLQQAVFQGQMTPAEILDTLTAIRQQTALEDSGVYKEHSLRNQRVVLRKTPFMARLIFNEPPTDNDLALLHACNKAFMRAGTSRTRGRGAVIVTFCDQSKCPIPDEKYYQAFKQEYMGRGAG